MTMGDFAYRLYVEVHVVSLRLRVLQHLCRVDAVDVGMYLFTF